MESAVDNLARELAKLPDEEINEMLKVIAEDQSSKLDKDSIRNTVENMLRDYLGGRSYVENKMEEWFEDISINIKDEIKKFLMGNYKAVVSVIGGQQSNNGIEITTRCCWDKENDLLIKATFENLTIFCVATVYMLSVY